MRFTREVVFDKAASIRGALDEVRLIIEEIGVQKSHPAAYDDLQKEINGVDRTATLLQEPDETATLAERQLFLEILLGGSRNEAVARSYVFEKIGYALQPRLTVEHLRGALDGTNRARFDASRKRL